MPSRTGRIRCPRAIELLSNGTAAVATVNPPSSHWTDTRSSIRPTFEPYSAPVLRKNFRNGLAHGFAVRRGGLEGVPGQAYFRVKPVSAATFSKSTRRQSSTTTLSRSRATLPISARRNRTTRFQTRFHRRQIATPGTSWRQAPAQSAPGWTSALRLSRSTEGYRVGAGSILELSRGP
jgi:hypothetical protein